MYRKRREVKTCKVFWVIANGMTEMKNLMYVNWWQLDSIENPFQCHYKSYMVCVCICIWFLVRHEFYFVFFFFGHRQPSRQFESHANAGVKYIQILDLYFVRGLCWNWNQTDRKNKHFRLQKWSYANTNESVWLLWIWFRSLVFV